MQKIDIYYIVSLLFGTFLGIAVIYLRLHIGSKRLSSIQRYGLKSKHYLMSWTFAGNTIDEKDVRLREQLLKHLPIFFEALPVKVRNRIVFVNRLLNKRITFLGLLGNFISFVEVNYQIGNKKVEVSCSLDFTEFNKTVNTISLVILIFMILPIWGNFFYKYSAAGSEFLTFGNVVGYLIPSLVLLIIPWGFWNKTFVAKKIFTAVDLAIRNVF